MRTQTVGAPRSSEVPPSRPAKIQKETGDISGEGIEEDPPLRTTITQKHIEGLQEEDDAHEAFNKKRMVNKLHVDIKGKSARVMHLTELLYGHKDADLKFAERALSHLETLSPKERPDVVVVSGLIFGSYQHREKNNRRTKTMSVNNQLGKAKEFIERLQNMGMTVIYNKSDNDQKIIEDYTYDAVRIVEGVARENGADWPTSFAHFDRAQQSHLWQRNYEFQWDVVFEYMLRCGRRLSTKEEVQRDTEEEIEEYLLLLDAHSRLERGEQLTSGGLANFIQKRANESVKNLIFLIGGIYGLDDVILKRANSKWSLSQLTFPHQLVRLILAEQVYRACTILKNEKYHHR